MGDAPASPSLRAHLRRLASHSLVYGAADVFSNVTNLLLIPVYTAFLAPRDYRDLAILALFSAVAKILFRFGLDAGFFRVCYDQEGEDRRRLAGGVALLAAGVGSLLFCGVVLAAGPLTRFLLGPESPPTLLVLAAADITFGTFAFVPLSLLRIQDRPGLFSLLSSIRHGVNIVLKVLFLVRGWGVAGVLWSDAIATAAFALLLLPILIRHARLSWPWHVLREVLAFGLPKVPHGFMIQVQNLADRKILDAFVSAAEVGLYHVAYTLGAGVKFALSAFEPAWGPFVYSRLRQPDAKTTMSRVITYAAGGFVAFGLALAVFASELLTVLTPANPEFRAAAPVIPVVVLAYLLHGAFLLSSIGIGIEKKARYYPLITAAAAGTNVAANLLLIPIWGMMGAAWATVGSYAVMAALGFALSQRLYPIPYEWARLGRIAAAGGLTYALSLLAPRDLWPAFAVKTGLLAVFPALVLISGFFRPSERTWLLTKIRLGSRD